MEKQAIATKVAEEFKTETGQVVDVLFGTSDGKLFYDPNEATEAGKKLPNKQVVTYYRDESVRALADKHADLQRVIYATDVLKRSKALKRGPIEYSRYVKNCEMLGMNPVPERVFGFIRSKVFRTGYPILPGEKDTILSWTHGIVEATFLRRYEQGQVWHYKDNLILTCPTNTELISGTYQDIFSPFL